MPEQMVTLYIIQFGYIKETSVPKLINLGLKGRVFHLVVQWVRACICEVMNLTYVRSSPLDYQDVTACHISWSERLGRCHWRVHNTNL